MALLSIDISHLKTVMTSKTLHGHVNDGLIDTRIPLLTFNMAKRKYLPNNWQAYKDMPDDFFQPLTFEEFEDWKINGYLIPDSVSCIMRIQNPKTGKIKEVYYNNTKWAQKRVKQCMAKKETFTLVSMDGTFHLSPQEPFTYDKNFID